MEFLEFSPSKKRRPILSHAMILLVASMTLVAFRLANDEITGPANVSDAYAFTSLFLVTSYYIGWLTSIMEKCKGTAIKPLVMPLFVALVLAYLYCGFRTYFIQPGVTGFALFFQLIVLVCVSCRDV